MGRPRRRRILPLLLRIVLLIPLGILESTDAAPAAPGTIRGRVLDVEGRPVAGARVFVSESDRGDPPVGDAVASGADGSYALEGIPAGGYLVFAAAKGHVTSRAASPVLFHPPERLRELVPDRPTPGPHGLERTGVDVRLEPAGALRVILAPEGERGDTVNVTAVRSPADQLEAERLGGAALHRTTWWNVPLAEGRTLELPEAAAGVWEVTAEGASGPPFRDAAVRVEPGRTATVRVVFPAGVTVSGRVLGPGGEAIAGAIVSVLRRDEGGRLTLVTTLVDGADDGRFRAEGLFPTAPHVLVAVPPRDVRHLAASAPLVVRGGERDVELRLRRSGTLRGRVVRAATHDPVPAFRVSPSLLEVEWELRVLSSLEDREFEAEDGTFTLDSLVPGRYQVRVTPTRESLVPARSRVVEVRPSAVTELGEIRLVPGAELHGTIRIDGAGAARTAFVGARPAGPHRAPFRAEHEAPGTYRIPGLPPGRYHLLVNGGPDAPWVLLFRTIEVEPAQREAFDIEIPAGGALLVRVMSRWGVPLPGARVTIRDPEGREIPTGVTLAPEDVAERASMYRSIAKERQEPNLVWPWAEEASLTDQEGALFRGCLPPGAVTVEIEAEGYEPRTFEVEIEKGVRAERVVILAPAPRSTVGGETEEAVRWPPWRERGERDAASSRASSRRSC